VYQAGVTHHPFRVRVLVAEVIAPRLRSFLLGVHPGRAGARSDTTKAGGR